MHITVFSETVAVFFTVQFRQSISLNIIYIYIYIYIYHNSLSTGSQTDIAREEDLRTQRTKLGQRNIGKRDETSAQHRQGWRRLVCGLCCTGSEDAEIGKSVIRRLKHLMLAVIRIAL